MLIAESVLATYSDAAPRNLRKLKDMGCVILYEVDVHTMRQHPHLVDQLFDRIVFNFPHAGFVFMENQKRQIK
jgi:25S rRNA (uracil2634-N3)-methyltransferase